MNTDAFAEALTRTPDDESLWLAFADWHEERGDPRAELMRHHSDALVAKYWATWFPNIEPHELELTWRHGFVHTATLADAAPLSLPSMKWLRELTLHSPQSLETIPPLPVLERITALIDDGVSEHELEKLKARHPRVHFTPWLHPEGHDFRWAFGPSTSATPQLVPSNVRELAPSGASWLNRCLHCASKMVLVVFDERAGAKYAQEFRCVKCGRYTAYRAEWPL